MLLQIECVKCRGLVVVQNKNILGDSGVIQATAPLLEREPIQFGAIGVLKRMTAADGKGFRT